MYFWANKNTSIRMYKCIKNNALKMIIRVCSLLISFWLFLKFKILQCAMPILIFLNIYSDIFAIIFCKIMESVHMTKPNFAVRNSFFPLKCWKHCFDPKACRRIKGCHPAKSSDLAVPTFWVGMLIWYKFKWKII